MPHENRVESSTPLCGAAQNLGQKCPFDLALTRQPQALGSVGQKNDSAALCTFSHFFLF